MNFAPAGGQLPFRPDKRGQGDLVVPSRGQPGALSRAVGGETGDDGHAARLGGAIQRGGIAALILVGDEEVQDRAVVPHGIRAGRDPFEQVGDQPGDPSRAQTGTRAGDLDGGRRDVKDRDVVEAEIDESAGVTPAASKAATEGAASSWNQLRVWSPSA